MNSEPRQHCLCTLANSRRQGSELRASLNGRTIVKDRLRVSIEASRQRNLLMPAALHQSLLTLPSSCREQAFTSVLGGANRIARRRHCCRADSDQNGGDPLSNRLKAAEAEAAALRKQLAAAREARSQVRQSRALLGSLAYSYGSLI